MGGIRIEDIQEVDSFLAATKTLEGGYPSWTESERPGELKAIWNIEDELGINRAHLRFRVLVQTPEEPSVSLIFRSNSVYRLDLKDRAICHPNPTWALQVGLPPHVCGSHIHRWEHNREQVRRTGEWRLPAREPLAPQLRRVPQALSWIAEAVNIELEHDQRGFDIPPRSELFEWNSW